MGFIQMKLVDDWRDLWKWSSTHVVLIASAAPIAWMQLPQEFKATVPEHYMPYIGGVMFVAAFIVARVRKQ
jgi:hypothetical protein